MASEIELVRAYVEKCLLELSEDRPLVTDEDGDFPYRFGTGAGWVMVVEGSPLMVRVVAHAAYGLKSSVALLREINELNLRAVTGQVALTESGVLVVSQTLLASAITCDALRQAMAQVDIICNDVGTLAATVFGGSTPFESEPADAG